MDSIAHDLLPYPSQELRVAAHTLRYLDVGDSDNVLLCVHGNPTWSFYYRGVIDRFCETHRVIAVDHLGCGRSDQPAQDEFPYTLAAHRDNLVALIDSLDLRNVTLIAHDWGGAIGLSALLERQDRFDRIVLLNTGAVSTTVHSVADFGLPGSAAGHACRARLQRIRACGGHDGHVSQQDVPRGRERTAGPL